MAVGAFDPAAGGHAQAVAERHLPMACARWASCILASRGQTRQAMGGEDVPYGVERYSKEVRRLYGVMDRRLAENEWLGGADYSIADMATYPWLNVAFDLIAQGKPEIVGEGANVKRWLEAVGKRPAVERGMAVPRV